MSQSQEDKSSSRNPGILGAFFKAAGEQLFGTRRGHDRYWRAYTRSGKIVVIDRKQVIEIIDPKQLPDK
jgi:hypothetical protein